MKNGDSIAMGSPKSALLCDPSRYMKIVKEPWYALLIELQDIVTRETYAFWQAGGVRTLHLPVTTSAVSSPMGLGSDSLPVEVDLFGSRTYLADSMQFLLEYACRINQQGCFYLMPSFRGEQSDETHLCQFYHSEVELPLGLQTTMDVAERYFKFLTERILTGLRDKLTKIGRGVSHLEEVLRIGQFPRIRFDEAFSDLKKYGKQDLIKTKETWRTLTRAGEKALLELYGTPFWITHWDHLSVPFYQAFEPDSGKAMNADFILGFGEVIGLGERHVSDKAAIDALHLHEVNVEPYNWYLRMKREAPMRTSGFGMGIERFLMWILAHDDIRDLQIIPRENGVKIIP